MMILRINLRSIKVLKIELKIYKHSINSIYFISIYFDLIKSSYECSLLLSEWIDWYIRSSSRENDV